MGGGEVSEGGATKFAKIRENAKIHPILQCSIKGGSENDQMNSKRGEAWGLGGVLIMWVCGVWEVLVPVIIKPGLPKINQNKPRLNYVSHSGCVRKAILVKMETSMIRK